MKEQTHYLNTDLDLVAERNLDALTAALQSQGVFPLHNESRADGRWYATLETEVQFDRPEPNIAAILTAIETLDQRPRELWSACTSREFNIGYDCGDAPWAFNHALSPPTLARIAALGISLRITLYPAATANLVTQSNAL
jgi:hypothetical protein